ncbi:hypothetical protein D3C81_1043790 [compost metagenome]
MSPPQLTGNTPVAYILDPMQINLLKSVRDKIYTLAGFLCCNCCLSERLHFNEPLRGKIRLNNCSAAFTVTNLVHVILNFDQNAHILHIFYNLLTAFTAIKSLIFTCSCVHRSALIHHGDLRQFVTKSYFKVIRVMCRGDFYSPTTEFLLYVFITDDRNFASDNRQNQCLTDQVAVTFILWMNSYCCITKHRFWACCSNCNISAAILERVLKMI